MLGETSAIRILSAERRIIYNGLFGIVVINPMGFRCGYVKLPKGHPWEQLDYDSIPCQCHGGLTFKDYVPSGPCGYEKKEYWIGFDCAHAGDGNDASIMSDAYRSLGFTNQLGGVARSADYVEEQIKLIIDQINDAEMATV